MITLIQTILWLSIFYFFVPFLDLKETGTKIFILLIAVKPLPVLHVSLWVVFYDRNIDNTEYCPKL